MNKQTNKQIKLHADLESSNSALVFCLTWDRVLRSLRLLRSLVAWEAPQMCQLVIRTPCVLYSVLFSLFCGPPQGTSQGELTAYMHVPDNDPPCHQIQMGKIAPRSRSAALRTRGKAEQGVSTFARCCMQLGCCWQSAANHGKRTQSELARPSSAYGDLVSAYFRTPWEFSIPFASVGIPGKHPKRAKGHAPPSLRVSIQPIFRHTPPLLKARVHSTGTAARRSR